MKSRKIDIVISYVNNKDENWIKIRESFLTEEYLKNSMATSNVMSRYNDNNELKYLLRSIEKYANFYNKLYIVTNTEMPEWFVETDRVRIVNHESFIEPEYLPTFSSRAIEANIHKIRYLKDYFIYINDDMFFNKIIEETDLFTEDKINVYFEKNKIGLKQISPENFSGVNANILAKAFIKHMFNKISNYYNAHAPKLIYKPDIIQLEEDYPELFHNVSKEKFRKYNTHSIIATLYSHYLLAKEKGVIKFDNYDYLENNDPDIENKYNSLLNKESYCVCINDTTDNNLSEKVFKLQNEFYEKKFPEKSKFEK